MVERKLRPAPSTLHLLPSSRKTAKTGGSSATKLFVLDTNVLMHDPTSLFRFEEHDIYLPMVVLEAMASGVPVVGSVAVRKNGLDALVAQLGALSFFLFWVVGASVGLGSRMAWRLRPPKRHGISR